MSAYVPLYSDTLDLYFGFHRLISHNKQILGADVCAEF